MNFCETKFPFGEPQLFFLQRMLTSLRPLTCHFEECSGHNFILVHPEILTTVTSNYVHLKGNLCAECMSHAMSSNLYCKLLDTSLGQLMNTLHQPHLLSGWIFAIKRNYYFHCSYGPFFPPKIIIYHKLFQYAMRYGK